MFLNDNFFFHLGESREHQISGISDTLAGIGDFRSKIHFFLDSPLLFCSKAQMQNSTSNFTRYYILTCVAQFMTVALFAAICRGFTTGVAVDVRLCWQRSTKKATTAPPTLAAV